MSVLPIVTGRNTKILRTVCVPVTSFDAKLKKLVESMVQTMAEAKGLGIAAPQVGVDARACIVILGFGSKNPVTVAMINPEVTYESEYEVLGEEGCLSLPRKFGNVYRAEEIIVQFCDIKGRKQQLKLKDLDARVVLHEIDHLNGVLFIDKLEDELVM
jgi:peptide deformylase